MNANLKTEQDVLYQKASAFKKMDPDYPSQLDENAAAAINLNKQLNNTLQNLDNNVYNLRGVQDTQKTALHDYNKYISRKVNTLDRQLHQFRRIEGDISTKDRLVEINQAYYEKQQKIVSTLMVAFLLFLTLIRSVTYYMSNTISLTTFSLIIFSVLILFLLYLIYYLDILGVSTFASAAIQDFEILARDVKNGVYIVRQEVESGIFGKKYCPSCAKPHHKGGSGSITDILDNGSGGGSGGGGGVVHNENSFVYYDGTEPPQSIIPWDKTNCRQGIPPPKWELKPNKCIPDSRKTAVQKPAYSDTEQDMC